MSKQTNYQTTTGTVAIGPIQLESGETLTQAVLAYEWVGPADAPVILVCHALTGNHITVGNPEEPGWWNGLIGTGQSVDTDYYQVITFNVLGGCNGSTGPTSINPTTRKQYRAAFPKITIRDMVHAQYLALQNLGVKKLYAIIGGSLGGMQALEWGLLYPCFMEKLIVLAVTPTLSNYGIAYNHIAEEAIKADPNWNRGNYSFSENIRGLEIARMIGMVTYRSPVLFEERFKRLKDGELFEIASYLNYQGEKLAKRFDANSYITLLQAMNSHDIRRSRGNLRKTCESFQCDILAIGYEHDLIYEPKVIREFASYTPNCSYHLVQTSFGHDGFLTEYPKWGKAVKTFLD
ncbi:homoserine O-acetyltransferase MetX [Ornithinibacillus bavariensis]|uniref:Homoserine O-acetyltransferase n=1 Tax=Ornithinibacillus bavariensis TaxID=545502 RepID=A0A920C740_9BACI|nr:homoserine O-acetyltransferase [Ornithinibacillus bavariensis]GIO26769.1 homoserine O-acetyltransferase [Ornithinibacillus bavariensis]HAM80782.1 homoserine O-acetyltransferase [Ornithinibacillus sp.]